MDNTYRNIGRIVSAFGLKGELIIQHHLGKSIAPARISVIFLEDKSGGLLPYFVEKAKKKGGDELYLKLEGTEDRESALKLLRKEVWLKEEEIRTHTAKNNPMGWVGYHVLDQDRDLGPVVEVIEQAHQILCRLEIDQKEVLIPVNEQTLQRVDHGMRRLLLNLPEGLPGIYLT